MTWQITYDMRPAGELNLAILDGLPLEAVEEEDDGHDQVGHQAPRQSPVQIWPEHFVGCATLTDIKGTVARDKMAPK